ncbi:endo-1,4-beta-xylanase [Sphingomonas nostoxanthinifaciens]|nr:endo-1,4-beta-xylanase [Sphingomonas nostoxanthinifaciens]
MPFDRRAFIAGAGAIACAGAARAVPGDASLDALARAKGMRFGTCLGAGQAGTPTGGFADPAYLTLIAGQCGLIVPENEMKWGVLRPSADRFDFAPADRLVAWATQHGLGVRGHNLLWQNRRWTPAWLEAHDFGSAPRVAGERMLRAHVETVAKRYAGTVRSFDVVNEAIDEKTGAYRETNLSHAIGGTVETIALAFHTARAAAPHAQLVYNDYMSWDASSATHRAAVLTLLETLKAQNVPVDALGIQGHIGSNGAGAATTLGAQVDEWRRFLDRVTATGLGLLVSEFDVNDKGLPADVAVRDRAVADLARSYLDVTLAYAQVDTLMCWGLGDRYSWLQTTSPRVDNLPKRPLPYDDALRAKPLRAAIAAALAAAPQRTGRSTRTQSMSTAPAGVGAVE